MSKPTAAFDGLEIILSTSYQLESRPGEVFSTTPLCDFCKNIFESWDHPKSYAGFVHTAHFGSLAGVAVSVKAGCTLCTQFLYKAIGERRWRDKVVPGANNRYSRASELAAEAELLASTQYGPTISDLRGSVQKYDNTLTFQEDESITKVEKYTGVMKELIEVQVVPEGENPISGFDSHALPPNLRINDYIRLCNEWLSKCEGKHTRCVPHSRTFVPTRLVCVQGKLRVVEHAAGLPKYATLSHCWGSPYRFATLMASNLEAFKVEVPADALSKTFADAIFVCRQLQIDYIWIDSLCIIQDDDQDWGREAALMTDVYENSYVTIAASGAADGQDGLFFPRPAAWRCRVEIPAAGGQKMTYTCLRMDLFGESILPMPLSGRGWVVQERLLPSRTVLFTDSQIFWECHEDTLCEMFPQSYPRDLLDRWTNSLKRSGSRNSWASIVEQYTSCKLTFQRDKLIAIAGVARRIQAQSGDQYVAGLWRDGLELSLVWSNRTATENNQTTTLSSTSACKAPTWSWASVSSPVSFPGQYLSRSEYEIHILDFNLPPGEDPFGATSSARISLACTTLVNGTISAAETSGNLGFKAVLTIGKQTLPVHTPIYSQAHTPGRKFWLLPIKVASGSWGMCMYALLLRDSPDEEEGCYERIGMMTKNSFYDNKEIQCCWASRKEYDRFFALGEAEAEAAGEVPSTTGTWVDENGAVKKVITLI